MGYIDDATIAAFKGSFNLGVFFRLGLPTPVCLSLSANNIPLTIPTLDSAGQVYVGAGKLLSIPTLETLINGIASTVSFSLQGVDPIMTGEMLDSAPEVLGAPVAVGIAPMDKRWQPAAPVALLWSGVGDFLAETLLPGQDKTKNKVMTLTLSAMGGDQSRQLGNNLTYTDLTQQALWPGDTFCQRTVEYYATQLVTWPRFS